MANSTDLLVVLEDDGPYADSGSCAATRLRGWQAGWGARRAGMLEAVSVRTDPPRPPAAHRFLLMTGGDIASPTTSAGEGRAYEPLLPWVGHPTGLDEPWREVLFYVLTWPTPGQADEFNRWYSTDHLTDVLAVPGFRAARRYRPIGRTGDAEHYLALYVFGGEPAPALQGLADAKSSGRMLISPTLARSAAAVYQPLPGEI